MNIHGAKTMRLILMENNFRITLQRDGLGIIQDESTIQVNWNFAPFFFSTVVDSLEGCTRKAY